MVSVAESYEIAGNYAYSRRNVNDREMSHI